MRKLGKSKTCSGFIVSLCLVACSDEVDRRDELGIEEDESGRYELVVVDGQKSESAVRSDSLRNNSQVRRDSVPVAPTDPSAPSTARLKETSEQAEVSMEQAVVFDSRGAYSVQIGGYRDAAKANGLVRELKDAGYPAYAIARPGSKEMRVRIGYFKTQVDADRFGAIFQADRGMEYWVDKRENE